MRVARAFGSAAVCALLLATGLVRGQGDEAKLGEAIYRRGSLESGAPLIAERGGASGMQGPAAACVNCHRRSGLGGREGLSLIPPITARYLYRPRSKLGNESDVTYVEGMRGDRDPYTDATLARAIREGIDSDGRQLSYLMSRFAIGETDMAALVDYLKQLDQRRVPGVTDNELHFATIITPDADPVKRRGMLAVLKQFFADRNARQMVTPPKLRSSGRTALSRSMTMVHRQWQLHVWELTGEPATWRGQLERSLAREPVLAVISGLGGANWAPVHEFCQHAALPCVFPNVEVPIVNERDFYSLYFSKGVLLEAELIANRIADDAGGEAPRAVLQIYRRGDSGEAAAHALAVALKRHGITVTSRALAAHGAREGVAHAIREAKAKQPIVLWLRANDIAALGAPPARGGEVYMSGLMAGLEAAPLPADWRSRTRLAYPFDLPERRRVRVDFALGWFRIRHIPVEAVQVQADTYLACGLLSETLNNMADTFVRDYLVERFEDTLEHRVVTGYYPRLALATGQRFASKGGYIVHFSEPEGRRLAVERQWFVPDS